MKIITGMHRSGTSLVARLAYEAGAEMGDPAGFYRPDRWNPDGYYEQVGVHRINMSLVNGPWGKLTYFKLPSEETVLRRGRKLAGEIRQAASNFADAVVKDPRFALTLPAWQAQGARVDGMLVCLRDPSSVAGSLRKRNRATRGHALRLWHEHNRRLLDLAEEVPTRFLYYPALLRPETYDAELALLLDFLDLETTAAKRRDLWSRCVKPGLDHNPPDEKADPPGVAELWRELTRRYREQEVAAPR